MPATSLPIAIFRLADILPLDIFFHVKIITYTNSARRQFRGLDPQVQTRLREKLAVYAETGAGDVVAMQGQGGARLRVGDYRIVFVEGDEAIEVRAVGHRRDVYR